MRSPSISRSNRSRKGSNDNLSLNSQSGHASKADAQSLSGVDSAADVAHAPEIVNTEEPNNSTNRGSATQLGSVVLEKSRESVNPRASNEAMSVKESEPAISDVKQEPIKNESEKAEPVEAKGNSPIQSQAAVSAESVSALQKSISSLKLNEGAEPIAQTKQSSASIVKTPSHTSQGGLNRSHSTVNAPIAPAIAIDRSPSLQTVPVTGNSKDNLAEPAAAEPVEVPNEGQEPAADKPKCAKLIPKKLAQCRCIIC